MCLPTSSMAMTRRECGSCSRCLHQADCPTSCRSLTALTEQLAQTANGWLIRHTPKASQKSGNITSEVSLRTFGSLIFIAIKQSRSPTGKVLILDRCGTVERFTIFRTPVLKED